MIDVYGISESGKKVKVGTVEQLITISFNAGNGGHGSMEDQNIIPGASAVLESRNGIYPDMGQKFINWNTSADGNGTPYADGATAPNESTTLYAQWLDGNGQAKVYWYYRLKKTAGMFQTGAVNEWTLLGNGKGGLDSFSVSSVSRGNWSLQIIGCFENTQPIAEYDTTNSVWSNLTENDCWYTQYAFTVERTAVTLPHPRNLSYTFNTDEPGHTYISHMVNN